MMIWIMVKKTIKLIAITEILVIASYLISFEFYINLQVAFLSSLFVLLGSAYSYKRMIENQVALDIVNEERDLLDSIEDPYELYDDTPINNAPVEELDLREIVKEERSKIKTLSLDSAKHGIRGGVSFFRLVPYIFLVLGFIALKNNELLNIAIYLPSLLVGIVIGSITSKELFKIS